MPLQLDAGLVSGHSIECILTPATRSPEICTLWPYVTLTFDLWPFDLDGYRQVSIVDVASLVIVVSAVFVQSYGQTHTHTDADERFTPATLVGVSKNININNINIIVI